MNSSEHLSTLYALIEGASALSIHRDDIGGASYTHAPNAGPALIIFDAVPGGAGHAQRIGDRLPELFRAALDRVSRCLCGIETSCYSCLRSYRNQREHALLSRGAAIHVLRDVLQGPVAEGEVLPEWLADDAKPVVREVVASLSAPPEVGWEIPASPGWQVEAAWPDARVVVVIDHVGERDAWLVANNWTILRDVKDVTVEVRERLLGV
jgi:ATP-dependent helicase YprA (DUF1998 family)